MHVPDIQEFSLHWPGPQTGSTHELVISPRFIYVTGQKMDRVAKLDHQGKLLDHYIMPAGSGPHGLLLDKEGRLWVSLEFHGKVVRLDDVGRIAQEVDVHIHVKGASRPINPAPHGITLDADGESIWFTGKRTSTIGKIQPGGSVVHFQLETLAALPIFLSAGPDGGIWGTELLGSSILHILPWGEVQEFPTPTMNSRPIAVIPDPAGKYMWFTEEAGVKVGRVDMAGNITEFPVPALQKNDILGSLTFDGAGNLWVQVYADCNSREPHGEGYLVRFDRSIHDVAGSDSPGVPYRVFPVPSGEKSMMHRIKTDGEGNLWYTEMMTDRLGKVSLTGG
ncbi:MAG: hypothetical protein V4850_26585 [Myxococcota bacterium]